MSVNRWDVISIRPSKGKDGNEKPYYHRIGVMFAGKKEGSFSIKLESLPIANEKGELWLSVFAYEPRDGAANQSQGNRLNNQIDDSIPFAMEWR